MTKREIKSMNKAIDRLVSPAETSPHKGTLYELSRKGMIYGLSEGEVRIVDGA